MEFSTRWRDGSRRAFAVGAWWRFLLLCAIPIGIAPLLLTSQWGQSGVTMAIGTVSALFCLWRARQPRGVGAAWLWIGLGLFLNASGSIVEAMETQVYTTVPMPSFADAFYLALYPCATIGLLLIVRVRYPGLGPARLIDASTLTVGLGLLCWVFLIRPTAAGATGSTFARAVQVSYPVGDLLLLAILARVMVARGWRTPAITLVAAGLLGFLLGDSAWALVNDNGWRTTPFQQTLLGEPFLLAFSLLGAAALHTSAAELDVAASHEGEHLSPVLLVLLALASLVAPALLVKETFAGRVRDGIAIAVCSTQITALVIARTTFLLRHVQRQARRLRDLSLEDELTGLPNRRALQSYLADSLQRARRAQHGLSVAMIDIDHFKRFNDEYGHPAGDQLLKAAAAAWKAEIRQTDMLARIGGEEFVLVLPDGEVEQAEIVVSKLRAATPLGQTFSAGVAQWDGLALAEELLEAVDTALYEAKRAGRDLTKRYEPAAATGLSAA